MSPIVLIVIAIGVAMIVVELLAPARKWPAVTGWWARAIFFNSIQVAAVYLAGIAWDGWMADNRPWSLDHWNPSLAGLFGYFILTFVYYWWHRARHSSQFLWNYFHQFHHSPRRLEVITSFYKSPVEILTNALLSSAVLYLLVGISPEAAAYATLLSGLAEFFYHWNVSTPHWIGYIIQRPESHCIHHERGVHRSNYGDLPIWDMMFGTFHNPRNLEYECGFEEDEELQILPMLFGKDVQKPIPAPATTSSDGAAE